SHACYTPSVIFGLGVSLMRRRDFIALVGSSVAGWPLAARAQQTERVRRIGILMPYPPTDAENRSRVEALRQELQRLGWRPGANIEFDEGWTTNNMDLIRANAANLVELKPDVIVASGGRVIPVLLQITREIPIVVPGTVDPIATGRSEEHTSELQSLTNLVCRLLLEKKNHTTAEYP